MSRAKQLLQLQEIEDDMREKLAALKKIQAQLSDSPEVRQAQSQREAAASALAQARTAQRERELEVERLDAKLKQESDRLYGGSVKNAKEVDNLRKEVEALNRRRGTLDEAALKGMEQVEELIRALAEAERNLAGVESQRSGQVGDLEEKEQKLKRYIAARRRQREAILGQIPAGDLAVLRDVQNRKGGKGVTALREGAICGLCGVTVSAAKLAQVRGRDELLLCGNCGRILAD